MSGQSFYKANNGEQDSVAQIENMDGQYKKLKVNAEYLQRPAKKRNDVSQEKEKNQGEYKLMMQNFANSNFIGGG